MYLYVEKGHGKFMKGPWKVMEKFWNVVNENGWEIQWPLGWKYNDILENMTFYKTQHFSKHNISQNKATFKKDYGNDYMSVHNSFAEEIMYCGKKFQSLPRCWKYIDN